MRQLRTFPIIILAGLFAIVALVACSSGGGGGTSNTTAVSGGDTGTVALFVKDGPVDAYESITIFISKVALIPADEEDDPVVVFESEAGEEEAIDLLAFRDDPYLFLVDDTIPAGTYAKIRLWVTDVVPEGGECDELEVKLPSGKIDLKPKGGFEVEADKALAIELDVDLEKSIDMHKAGKSGKCIFRPVIFVDIYDHPSIMPKCPRIIRGTIEEILLEKVDEKDVVIGFKMALAKKGTAKKSVTVLTENAVVFDGAGDFVEPDTLEVGDEVKVRGKVNDDGNVDASLVVVGDVAEVKGVATSAVGDVTEDIFSMLPDDDQAVVSSGTPLSVLVADDTLVLMGCNDEVGPDAIQEGMDVMVIGKIGTDGVFKAVAVLLRPLKINGVLVAIDTPAGGDGKLLTVQTNPDDAVPEEVTVFLPEDVYPHIKGDGIIPLEMLEDLLGCQGLPVELKLDPVADEPEATDVAVLPLKVEGVVAVDADPDDLLIPVDVEDQDDNVNVKVSSFTTLLQMGTEGEKISPIEFGAIEAGDKITAFGLADCVEAGEPDRQIAFVVVVEKTATEE